MINIIYNLSSSFDHANLESSFRGSNYLPKIINNVHLFEYEHLKHFVWKYDNIFFVIF